MHAAPPPASGDGAARSRWLRIEISGVGQVAVDLSFPASCAARLMDLVPADLGRRIAERGEDLASHSLRAVANGFMPGELFLLRDSDRSVRVWLE